MYKTELLKTVALKTMNQHRYVALVLSSNAHTDSYVGVLLDGPSYAYNVQSREGESMLVQKYLLVSQPPLRNARPLPNLER